MKSALWFVAGGLVATAVVTRLEPADSSTCCRRLAVAARDKIAGMTGPLSSLTAWSLDALGLTRHIPGLLDKLGVPVGDE